MAPLTFNGYLYSEIEVGKHIHAGAYLLERSQCDGHTLFDLFGCTARPHEYFIILTRHPVEMFEQFPLSSHHKIKKKDYLS